MMFSIESNNVLVYTYHFGISDIYINIDRFIHIVDSIFNPDGFTTVAESNNFAAIILLQYHSAQKTVNICIDDDVLVLVK